MILASVFVIQLLDFLLILIGEIFGVFIDIVPVLDEVACILDCEVFALINLYVAVPLFDGPLFLFLFLVKLGICHHFSPVLFLHHFLLKLFPFFIEFLQVLLIFNFFECSPRNGFPESNNRIRCLDRALTKDVFEVYNTLLKMNLATSVQNNISCAFNINVNRRVRAV